MHAARLILASASPRRRELLEQIGVRYRCDPAAIDESQRSGEHPSQYVLRMAQEKARIVAARYRDSSVVVLAADTSVVIDDAVLGKPRDAAHAMDMLQSLGGRWHTVLTAVCITGNDRTDCELVATEVEFVPLDQALCAAYLASDEPWDKAGAYAIQGLAGAFVRAISGSYSNVVGLPLCETWQLLNAHGIPSSLTPSAHS
ncbi:MAG: Maf family protein [Halioglobus sp.]